MGFPLLVRAIRLSFEAIDRRLEDAASTLAPHRLTFLTVTLPLALPGIIAGFVLCFAKARRVGATSPSCPTFRARRRRYRAAIIPSTQIPGGDAAAFRLVLVAVAIALWR